MCGLPEAQLFFLGLILKYSMLQVKEVSKEDLAVKLVLF